jgi:hypothetical protein
MIVPSHGDTQSVTSDRGGQAEHCVVPAFSAARSSATS